MKGTCVALREGFHATSHALDLNDTYLTQLTFGCCHSCHDPGSLILWRILGKELSTAGSQLVLCLHGNNLLLGILR